MRAWIVLLFLPLAGCIGGGNLSVEAGLFSFSPIYRGDPAPVQVTDCYSLLTTLNDRAETQALVRLEQSLDRRSYYRGFESMEGDVAMADGAATAAPGAPSAAGAEVTGTNNQESGVDEADLLKTDGEWTYVLQYDQLLILHSSTVGNLTEYSRTTIEGAYGGQLLLDERSALPNDDRLMVITSGGSPTITASVATDIRERTEYGMTRIQVYSLADRKAPEIIEEIWVEGNNVGARLVDGTAYVVVHEYEPYLELVDYVSEWETMEELGMEWEEWRELDEDVQRDFLFQRAVLAAAENKDIVRELTLRDHLPVVLTQRGAAMVPEPMTTETCARFATTPDDTGRSTSTILSLDIGKSLDYQFTQIVGGRPIVYGAQDALVLAASSQDFWWFWAQPDLDEATNLHWFDLDGLDVTHRASGRVMGIIQDQFGIDVHNDQLRVATTTGTWGRWWLENPLPMENHLVVFTEVAGKLLERGRVGGIAPDERLWSARFTDDRAYLVTFEQIDPLWIIDLKDSYHPKILGELEIPGVSTYIHPINDNTLLTIGYGPRENGEGLEWDRIQVSLFDIRNPYSPKRADVLDISPGGKGWSWSGATHEHKAFNYWPAIGKLAVPMSTHNYERVYVNGEWEYREDNHIGLRLIDVNLDKLELSVYGDVDQDHLLVEGQGYPYGGLDIQRSYFLGYPDSGPVSVYSMSGLGMAAHDVETLEEQDSVAFGIEGGYYHYYD